MHAYPDSKCIWGYMLICEACKPRAPAHVDIKNPIRNPPATGKIQECELCGKKFFLRSFHGDKKWKSGY